MIGIKTVFLKPAFIREIITVAILDRPTLIIVNITEFNTVIFVLAAAAAAAI